MRLRSTCKVNNTYFSDILFARFSFEIKSYFQKVTNASKTVNVSISLSVALNI